MSAPDHVGSIAGFPIRILPLIVAATGFIQQRLTPTPPSQAMTMYLMNFFMLFIFYGLPSGLVFYWTVMNLLTALQQWLLLPPGRRARFECRGGGGAEGRRGKKARGAAVKSRVAPGRMEK